MMRCKGKLQPPLTTTIIIPFLLALLVLQTSSFTFSSAQISVSDLQINSVATYSFSLARSYDDSLNPTDWNSSFVPSSATATIIFPSQFTTSQLASFTCSSVMVNLNSVLTFSCSSSANTIIVSNLFSGSEYINQVDLTLDNIINPSSAVTTSAFLGTIETDISNDSPIADVTFSANSLSSLSVSFQGGVVNRTSDMIVTLTTTDAVPTNAIITVQFPATNQWARETSTNNLIPINGVLTCYGLTSEISNSTIQCQGQYSTHIITLSSLFTSAIPANGVISFAIKGLFAPPTTEQADTLIISTCDSLGNAINTKTSLISGLVAQTLTPFTLQSSLTTVMGVNNFAGGLTFTFTLTDTISIKNSFIITFPLGTTITYSQKSCSISLQSVTYNSTALTFTMIQNSTNLNYFAGTSITFTFIRYKAPPSTKTTLPIVFSIMNNGFSSMVGSASITAIANNYTLLVSPNSSVVNVFTRYNFTFTMSDALTSTGYLVIILDPQLCVTTAQRTTITTNLSITISGSSINTSPSTQISTTTSNGSSTYQLLLSNLNTSSTIPTQTVSILVNNLLNPASVTTINSFALSTYYSNSADLVANANYSSSFMLQTGTLSLLSVTSTASTTYTFTVLTLNIQNTNPIPVNGFIMLTLPSQITLLSATQTSIQISSSMLSSTYTNSLGNNTITFKVGTSIAAASTVSLIITDIMTQSSTKTTSTFVVSTYDSSFNGIDQSSDSLGLSITSGNNFNSLSLSILDPTNSKETNYTITFEQIQSYSIITKVSLTFSSFLSTSSLSRVFQVTSSGTVFTPCIFSKVNTSYVLVTLSQSSTFSHTLLLQTIGNPPSQAPLTSPILVRTLTSDSAYFYSQMYTNDIINTIPSKLTINSYEFSSYVFSSPTNLSLSITTLSVFPTLTYKLVIDIPAAIDASVASCSSNTTNLQCSLFAPTNTLTVSMSNSASLPLNIVFSINSLTAPAFGSSAQTFTLATFDANSYPISLDDSTVVFNNNCSLACRTCSSSNSSACLSCYFSSNLTLLYGQTCLNTCPSYSYQDNLTCIDCSSSCLTCSNSSSNCSSCNSTGSNAFYYFDTNSSTGSCLVTCNVGTYATNLTCKDCLSTCTACNSSSYCFQCQPGLFFYNGTCLNACPNTTLTNSSNSSCQDCQSPCSSCSNTTVNCLTCVAGNVLFNSTCTSTCPQPNLYVSSNQTCELCDSICKTCFGTSSNCTSCDLTSNFTHFYNFTCTNTCPELYYSNVTTAECLLCSTLGIGCSNCSSATTCLSCDSGLLFFPSNSTCLNSTPSGYFNNNGTLYPCNSSCNTCNESATNCTSCSGNASLYQNQCVTQCPANLTVSVSNVCQSCSYPCATCLNFTSKCLSCYVNSSLYYDSSTFSCVNATSCPNSTFSDNFTYVCLTCNASCLICSGNSINCSSCSVGFYLFAANSFCSSTCPDGTVKFNSTNGSICQTCQYPCGTCLNTANYCLSCSQANSSLFLSTNGTCVSNTSCQSTTYANTTTFQCQSCVSPCSTCQSADICNTCLTNYSLISSNSTCSSTCPVGQAPAVINGSSVCALCSYPCSTCDNTITNCTSCYANSSLYLQGNQCVNASACVIGTYANSSNNSCLACPSSCSNCSSLLNCSNCTSGYFLDADLCVTATACQNGTVSGYNSTSGRNQCLLCTSPCTTCTITITTCLSCSQSNSSLFLLNNSCVNASVCPSGTFADQLTFTCLACVSPCQLCSNYSICITCIQDYFLNGTQCLGLCPNDTFVFNQSGIVSCVSCNDSCATCSHGATICTSCSNGSYLFNGSCLNSTACPSGTFPNANNSQCTNCSSPCLACQDQQICTSCSSNLSILNGSCYSSCPNGTISLSVNGTNICVSCSIQCLTCTSSVNNCTSCSNSSTYLYNGSCYDPSSCPNGTFVNSVNSSCTTCNSTCQLCSNMSNCQACSANFYLLNSTCISLCPNGTLAINTTNTCESCQYPCATCSNSLTNCTSCASFNSSSLFFFNNSCYNSSQCPQGTFQNNLTLSCDKCVSPCANCLSLVVCQTCAVGFYLNSNSSCLTTCPNGTIAQNSTSGGVCNACTYPCTTCSISLTNCTACSQTNGTLFLGNGSCVANNSCSNETYANSTTLKCQACSAVCSSCLALSSCISCASDFYLNGTSCISTCPNGTVQANSTSGGICQACSYPCNTCSGSTTNCSTCSQANGTMFFANNSCVANTTCPNGTYPNITTLKCQSCVSSCSSCSSYSICETCSVGFYYSNLTCTNSSGCPNGTLAQNSTSGGVCQTCSYPCTLCSGSLSNCTQCSQANSTLYLANGSCVSATSCANGTYANNTTFKCESCPLACTICASLTTCSACNSPFFLSGSSCVSTCPNGKVGDNSTNTCINCQSPCDFCSVTQSNCTSCLSPFLYYSLNNSCLNACPDGFYGNSSILKCQACVSPCSFCSSASTCITCASGFYLFGSSCLANCPNGYFNDNSTSNFVCSLCTNNCSTCSGVNTCTSCLPPRLLFGGICGTSCPSTAIYNVSNTCLNCYDAIPGCLACNTTITSPVCLLCNSSTVLSSGNCINPQTQKDALSNSLTSATIFPLPFTITGSIIFIACFMSKLQNKNSYVVGTAYSLFGFIESACLIYTIISYHVYIANNSPAVDYQTYLQAAMFLIVALNIFGLFVQTYQLHIDQKFKKWIRSKCNYCCYIVVTILSFLLNYKFKMLIFTKLFSFYCLRAQLDSVQKFRVFNVMSFLGVGHEGLVIYISAIIMSTLPTKQQMFISFLDLVIVNVINIGLALAVSSKEETFFEEEEDDGVKINKVFNLYDDSYGANVVDSVDEKKGKGKFQEKPGLQSRDMMMDDDDQFTLSISDRDESNRSQTGKIVPDINSSAIMKQNKSAILDSQASHDNTDNQPSETGNSLKKSGKAANINNFSAVYGGDLSRAKRKKFQESHRISQEIAEKSKNSSEKGQQVEENNIAQQQNIFDVGAIDEQAEHHEAQNHLDVVAVGQTNKESQNKPHEDHEFDQFLTGVDNTLQVFVKENKAQPQHDQANNKLNPSASNASMIPSVREIKVYKGRQPQSQQPQDIEEIDLTISKKQRELIELRKSIRKKERERQRSQERKSRKRSNSKEKRSKDAMSEMGMFVPHKSKDIMSSRGSHEQTPSNHLEVIERNMEASKLIQEQLVAPVSHSPKKPKTLEGAIAEEISQQNAKDKIGKLGNTIEEQMIESTIVVDETKQINFDKDQPQKTQEIIYESEPANRSQPKNLLIANPNPNQANIIKGSDGLNNTPSNASFNSNNPAKLIQPIKAENALFQPSNQNNPSSSTQPKKIKVQFQDIDRQYDNKYFISPREEINYDIQEMNYDFVDPDSAQHRKQEKPQNIFEYRKEDNSFISQQPSEIDKRKLVGFISKPHKKINPDFEGSDSQRNDNQFNFQMAPDTQNNPLENKIKNMGKKGGFGSNKSHIEQDALDQMVDKTSRIQVSKNRSHLIRKGQERQERDNMSKRMSNKEMQAIPTQESRLYQQLNEGSTVRETSDKELTQRKIAMNRPPLQNQRPATTQKHGRTHITGLKHANDQYQRRTEMEGNSQRNDPLAARTSYDMSFKEFKSNQFDKEAQSNRFDMNPSSFSSNRIQLDSDELARQPNKPVIKRTNRLGQQRQMKEEEGSLQDSFARKSMKSYKSRSIDREDYQLNQQQQTLANSCKKSINRPQQNDDLNEYYKRSKDSPSNHSNKSRSRSKSRQGNRSSDRRSRELQKIYLQRMQFKK